MSSGPMSSDLRSTLLSVLLFSLPIIPRLLPRSFNQESSAKENQLLEELRNSTRDTPFYKFVLTGGPCGGKTTALERVSNFLRERGFSVYTVPEAATIMFTNGGSPMDFSIPKWGYNFQSSLLRLQMQLEDTFEMISRSTGRPSVLLCDRGLMDGKGYMCDEDWERLVRSNDFASDVIIRENRYNAVFHLVTAAIGAERYYTTANNSARHETVEEAKELDGNTQRAWVGHPQHFCFDNRGNFEDKLQRMIRTVGKLVGLPGFERSTTKFLLKNAPSLDDIDASGLFYQVFDIEKIYLYEGSSLSNHPPTPRANSPVPTDRKGVRGGSSPRGGNDPVVSEYSFIRKRTTNSVSSYGVTTVQTYKSGEKVEIKRIITAREYASAQRVRDTSRHIVVQKRISFIYNEQSFNIHVYVKPVVEACILHLQGKVSEEELDQSRKRGVSKVWDFPDFVEVERPLDLKGDDKELSAYSISVKKEGNKGSGLFYS